MKHIPIIDIFAGPGGLGEGFSSVLDEKGERPFKIALSVEMEKFAHQTLTLRSFYRQFLYKKDGHPPENYYKYLAGEITREELFAMHKEEAEAAVEEAVHAKIGDDVNFHHDTFFDTKIKNALSNAEDWVLIGGPPCQAYSLVGRSRRTGGSQKGKQKKEQLLKFETDPKHTLYREYLRIIARHNPSVFVMENVKGILSSKLNGELIFPVILNDLKYPKKAINDTWNGKEYHSSKYEILSLVTSDIKSHKDYIIKAENYGIPQARHRVILLGVRKDIYKKYKKRIQSLNKQEEKVEVLTTIEDLPSLRSGLSKISDSPKEWKLVLKDVVKQTWYKEQSKEIKRVLRAVAYNKEKPDSRGNNIILGHEINPVNAWYKDEKHSTVCNHESRGHMVEDIFRYIYVSAFGKVHGFSPKLADLPKELLPKHKNVYEGINDAKFADRFRVQIADRPSTTVTCHISKDGHYFIHPDPLQARSLTVREAARLQTFPDNYFFEGPRTAQYHQVGNAVPPFLAYQIGQVVAKLFGKQIIENS